MGTHRIRCKKCGFEDYYIERFKHKFYGTIYHSFICYRCKKIIRLSYDNPKDMKTALVDGKCPDCDDKLVSFNVFSKEAKFEEKPVSERFTKKQKLICPMCKGEELEIVYSPNKIDVR